MINPDRVAGGEPAGWLDRAGDWVEGWACLPTRPDRRLRVTLVFRPLADGTPAADDPAAIRVETVADGERGDLRAAGIATGRHGFRVPVPPRFRDLPYEVTALLPDFADRPVPGSPRRRYLTPPPHVLRPLSATEADLGAYVAWRLTLNRRAGLPGTAAAIAAGFVRFLRNPGHVVFALDTGTHLIGACQMGFDWPADRRRGGIALGIEVDPDVRGFGLGHRLLAAARAWAIGRHTRIDLAVSPANARAIKLYHSLGFQADGTANHPETGETFLLMALPLALRVVL